MDALCHPWLILFSNRMNHLTPLACGFIPEPLQCTSPVFETLTSNLCPIPNVPRPTTHKIIILGENGGRELTPLKKLGGG